MAQKKSVLIIEDDQLFAEKLKHTLINAVDEVTVVETVARGTYFLPKLQPYMVFLDNKLPIIKGLEVITFFKELSPNTKIVMMSGVFSNKQKQDAINCKADYIIDKEQLTKTNVINIINQTADQFTAKNVAKNIKN